jgi:hypothetical protein
MHQTMKKTYRIFARQQRSGKFYLENTQTGQQESLETTDRQEAERICDARNLERQTPELNLKLGFSTRIVGEHKAAIAAVWRDGAALILSGPTNRRNVNGTVFCFALDALTFLL